MLQEFAPGDILVFQLESGYGLLRVLDVENGNADAVWHVAAFNELFLDVESAEDALTDLESLSLSSPHIALTNRAFESTQVARISNIPLADSDIAALSAWRSDPEREVHDRSVRLMLGLR
ncbi:MAG: hypothetical protein ABI791_12185 [Acidobacteriota bacterium]